MRRGKRIMTACFLLLWLIVQTVAVTGCGDDAEVPSADNGQNQEVPKEITLSLEPAALEIEVGAESILTAVCSVDEPLSWESSEPTVASVENGKVTGLKAGQTVVTAACGDVKKACTVTVKEKKPTLAAAQDEYTLTVGEKTQIVYEYASADPQAVVFTVSAPEIVSVDEAGQITAHKEGEAEITIEAEGLKASCRVKVLPKALFVYLSHSSVYMKPKTSFSLSATVEPAGALQNVKWESSNTTVATVSSDGKISALQKGYALITASATNSEAQISCEVYVVSSDPDGAYVSGSLVLTPNKSVSLASMLTMVGATEHSEVFWESDDPFVASVDSKGVVTAGGYGMAVITVTNLDTGEYFERVVMVELTESGESRPDADGDGGNDGADKPLVDLPTIMLDVPYINQRKKAPTGCESASSAMVLQYWGFDISMYDFIETKLDIGPYPSYVDGVRRGPNPWITFPGNPKSSQGYGCYAPAIVLALQKVENIENYTITYGYSVEQSKKIEYTAMEGATFVDTSNMTVGDLCTEYLAKGLPVIFWGGGVRRHEHIMYAPVSGTSWYIDDTDEKFRWTAYEHCLVLVGCDSSYYYFNDPLESKQYKYSRASVESAFEAVYSQFVVLSPIETE